MRRARYVLAACLLLAFWLFPFDRRAGGGEAKSGTGWNDGEMPPVFNPYVEDEAEETDEMRIVLFEGVSRDIPAYVLDGLRRQGGSLDVAVRHYFEDKRFDTLFTPTGLLSLCYGKDSEDKIIARIASPEKDPKLWDILKLWACARLPDVFDYFSRARRLDALRLEYLRRMEERRLMAELGAENAVHGGGGLEQPDAPAVSRRDRGAPPNLRVGGGVSLHEPGLGAPVPGAPGAFGPHRGDSAPFRPSRGLCTVRSEMEEGGFFPSNPSRYFCQSTRSL